MKNSKLVLTSFLLALMFIAFNPQDALAQNNRKTKKEIRKKSRNRNSAKVRVAGRNRTVITTAPRGKVIRHRNINYRYDRGIFYRPQGNGFVATRPPVGIRITVLPPSHIRIFAGNRPYYYHDGIYYNSVGNNIYEVTQPPLGARINQIPPYNELVYIDGREYYLSEGTYYKVVQNNDGTLAYEVTGFA